jgi:hypothetical protein
MRPILLQGALIRADGSGVEFGTVDPAILSDTGECFRLLKLRGQWQPVQLVAYSRHGPGPNPHAANILVHLGFDLAPLAPQGDVVVLGYDIRSGHERSLTPCQARLLVTK